MKYALIYSYENHNYELVENNRSIGDAEIEKLYEFSSHELGTAKKILSNLLQAQQAA